MLLKQPSLWKMSEYLYVSEYTYTSRILNMPWVRNMQKIINMAKFWIWQGSQYGNVTQRSEYVWIFPDKVMNGP